MFFLVGTFNSVLNSASFYKCTLYSTAEHKDTEITNKEFFASGHLPLKLCIYMKCEFANVPQVLSLSYVTGSI